MTNLVIKISNFFKKQPKKDPVFKFFFESSARDKKKIYLKALKKAQEDQERTIKAAQNLKLRNGN